MNKYNTHGFFFLRRPLLSLKELYKFEKEIESNPDTFEPKIINIFENPLLQEALFISSPSLYEHFLKVLSKEYTGATVSSICESLYKYFLRMTSRATPYGLFAGTLTGELTDETNVKFKSSNIEKYARLDMNYVNELFISISTNPLIKNQLKFKVNNSLYQIGDKYRYISYNVLNKKRNYSISAVSKSIYIDKILDLCGNGAHISDLINCLISKDISYLDAEIYVNNLIESQILISDLEPNVTGPEYFDLLINKLEELKGTSHITEKLYDIKNKLKLQDYQINKYYEIKQIISENFSKTDSTDLIQIDTHFELEKPTLNKGITNIILKEIEELTPLMQNFSNSSLENFKQKFYARYEESEISLLLALDNELGVGFDKATSGKGDYLPLIEGISIPVKNKKNNIEFGDLEKIVNKIYLNAIEKDLKIINLSESELNEFKSLKFDSELPNSFSLMGSLESESVENLEDNFMFFIKALSGPTSCRLLGRFCSNDNKLNDFVIKSIQEEEELQPDKIFAEIAHLPEARVGNVIAKPHLRKYEIPFMVGSTLPKNQQIDPNDLMISVPNGKRIRIFSKKMGKEIIPRITNAHNYSAGLSLYKFLGALQSQDEIISLNWSWGIHSNSIFLPRIQYKHLLLERAKWNLNKENLPILNKSKSLTSEDVLAILKSLNIPKWFVLLEGDNELPLNLKNPISIKILTDKLKKYGSIILTEFLGNKKQSWLQNELNDPLANELIIPCIKNTKSIINGSDLQDVPKIELKNTQRVFPIGSNWLYIKIYTGTKTADKILVEKIKPLVESSIKSGLIEKWFFIRYNDPDDHLRIRFYNSDSKVLWSHFLEKLYTILNPLVTQNQIIKYQLETYHREIERYTSEAIEYIENWFYHNSTFILELIDSIEGESGEEYRWLLGAKAIDEMLSNLGYSLIQKKNILFDAKESFFTEFNGNTELMVNLNDNYRKISKRLASFMNKEENIQNEIDSFEIQIELHNIATANLKQSITTKINQNQLVAITHSLIHMFINRLFISNQRIHELVLYHYLYKYYESMWARQKKNLVLENIVN